MPRIEAQETGEVLDEFEPEMLYVRRCWTETIRRRSPFECHRREFLQTGANGPQSHRYLFPGGWSNIYR
jgi:hypothetical protein